MFTVPDIKYCGRFTAVLAVSKPTAPAVCITVPDVPRAATHVLVSPNRDEWVGLDASMQVNLIHGALLANGVRQLQQVTWSFT